MSKRHNRGHFQATPPTPTTDRTAKTSDGFLNIAARMGMRADNVNSDATYIFDMLTKNRVKLEAMYRGSWIVGAAIDSVAEDMTRAGVQIKGSDDPDQIEKLQSGLSRTGVWGALLDAIKWARLYGGSLAFIVIDGQDPATPLDADTIGVGQFKGLKVYDRWQLQPDLTNIVQGGIDDGLPMFYNVVSDINSGQVGNLRIHYTRTVRLIGIQLPAYQAITEQLWGESVIERLYDRLIAFDSATTGAMNLIQKAHLRTVRIDKLREVLAAGGQAEENLLTMFHHMRHLQTNEGITLLDKEDEFATHQYGFGGISDMILQFGQQISGALGIPLVRLFGQSPAGLNSSGESDLRTYYDNIAAQQESRLREGMERILRVLHRSLFGQAPPENFDFDFTPLWQTSAKEKADIAASVTNTVVQAFEAGIIDHTTAMKELRATAETTAIFTNIDEADIEAAKMEPPPPPVEIEESATDSPKGLSDRLMAWVKGNG
jgi:phage-related protein (TIGR01555 family)